MSTKDKIRIKVSKRGYKEKPKADDIKKITWDMKHSECKSVNLKQLANILQRGHSVILADFKELGNIKEDNINSLSLIALDIDSKENKITMYEMIAKIRLQLGVYPVLSYCTFSDADSTKFRLIYRLNCKIDVATYKKLYLAMQWKYKKYLDPATKNANRIWAGTNKKVIYTENDIPISFNDIVELFKKYESSLKRKNKKMMGAATHKIYKKIDDDGVYIKPVHKEEVLNYLINNIDLREFIPKHLGGRYKRTGENIVGSCAIHGGDNESALVISKNLYTCFTHCGTGNIITIARKVYNTENFSAIALRLLEEHNLSIPEEYIKRG